jgi:hypothetical protein
MKLWLDDERPQPEGWVWAKTADEAIHHLTSHQHMQDPARVEFLNRYDPGLPPLFTITHMSFDHDLADVHYGYWHAGQTLPEDHPVRAQAKMIAAREKTGYDVILWMAEHNVWPTEACYVHTHNNVRGPIMADMINRYGPYEHKTVWMPYRPPVGPIPQF